MALSLTSTVEASTFFKPKALPTTDANTKPLTIVRALVLDNEKEEVELMTILGAPDTLEGGSYSFQVESREKKGKQGINYWYRSHSNADGSTSALSGDFGY